MSTIKKLELRLNFPGKTLTSLDLNVNFFCARSKPKDDPSKGAELQQSVRKSKMSHNFLKSPFLNIYFNIFLDDADAG